MKSCWTILVVFMLAGCSQRAVNTNELSAEFAPASPAAVDQGPEPGSSELDAAVITAAEAILASVNVRRALSGIPPLIELPELTTIASQRSLDMAVGRYLGHVDPRSGEVPVERMLEKAGFKGQAAELLYHSQKGLAVLADEVVETWFVDKDHQLVLLSPEFRYCGIGIMGDGQAWNFTAVLAGDFPGEHP